MRTLTKCRKVNLKARRKNDINQVVRLLNTINGQLIGINTTMNNDLNNLSSVISNDNSNLNANVVNAISSLNASLSNRVTTSTNTVISNMNNRSQSNCTVQQFNQSQGFSIPCGTSSTIIQQRASTPPERVFIIASSSQLVTAPCQAILAVNLQDGTIIERELPPRRPPSFFQEVIFLELDNYASVSIRCESSVQPPPVGAVCNGFVEVREFVCICCSDNEGA